MFQTSEKFGDYEVIQILGADGVGQVYKVHNRFRPLRSCEATAAQYRIIRQVDKLSATGTASGVDKPRVDDSACSVN